MNVIILREWLINKYSYIHVCSQFKLQSCMILLAGHTHTHTHDTCILYSHKLLDSVYVMFLCFQLSTSSVMTPASELYHSLAVIVLASTSTSVGQLTGRESSPIWSVYLSALSVCITYLHFAGS